MFRNFTLFICAFSLFALSNLYFANSAVVGLDLGSEYMKISSISPGKSFYIVEDTTTKRKTPTSIAFYSNERIFEYDTLVKRPKAFQTTFTNLPKFLGKTFGDAKLQEQAKTYLEDYIITESERGTPSFGLKSFSIGEEEQSGYSLTIEELLGMIFRHVSRLIQKQTERHLKDIAVTVPPYWAFAERYALQDALLLADFNPLAFMSENTGAALYYALERLDTEPHYVIFYNLGSTSLKVSLVEFSTQNSTEKHEKNAAYESLSVIAEAWDQDVGSINIDLNLLHHFAKEFDSKPARKGLKSVLTSNPAKAKLLKEVNKLKEILSANKQASIYLENLFDSTDFKSTIDRATFEEINAELFKRLTKPIDEVLAKAGKTINDVHAFELIGGGIRVPKLQQVLSEHLNGKEVSTHLNGDESMALGAAFHAANLSASFKTRQIYVNDGYNFDIRVELKDLEPVESTEENAGLNKSAVLFPYKTRFGSKKILAFEHDGDIKASFYAQLPGRQAEENVIGFSITGLKEAKEDPKLKDKDLGKTKVNLHFRLTPLGLIELAKAEATIEEIVLYEDTTTTTEKKETTEETKETTEETAEKTAEDESETPKETQEEDSEKKFKRKTVTHHIPLKVTPQIPAPGPMTEDQLEKSRDLLSKFDHYEEQKKKIAEAKNKLEAFLYATRDYLEDDSFSGSAKEEEKEQLRQMLEEHSEWLYTSEAASASHTPFTKKFEDMDKIVSKIRHRVTERLNRPELVEKAKEALHSLREKVSDIITTKPWITEEARDKAVNQIDEIKTWLSEQVEKQEALLHHDDPVLTGSQINSKLEKAKSIFERIKNTVKPKPPKNETAGADKEPTFNKDGKFDEASFKEYMKKMNITMDDLNKYRKEREEKEAQEKSTGENTEKVEVNDEPKTESEPETEKTEEFEPETPKARKIDQDL